MLSQLPYLQIFDFIPAMYPVSRYSFRFGSAMIACLALVGVCILCLFPGLLIEVWKVTKVVEIKVDLRNLIGGVIPRISFVDRPSYTSETKKYDMVWWEREGERGREREGCVCV